MQNKEGKITIKISLKVFFLDYLSFHQIPSLYVIEKYILCQNVLGFSLSYIIRVKQLIRILSVNLRPTLELSWGDRASQ